MPDHFSRQEAWLEAELVRARSLGVRHIMVFQVTRRSRAEQSEGRGDGTLLQHIPWFVSHPAEGEVSEEVKPGLRMKFNIDR